MQSRCRSRGAPAGVAMPDRARTRAPRSARPPRKLWEGRLPGGTSPLVERYTSSLAEDRRLGADDVDVSLAHARMLRGIGILSAGEHRAVDRGLRRIRQELLRDTFEFAASDEDIHSAVERRLFAVAGDAAGKLQSGRSRNDQVATDLRLYVRRACAELALRVVDLQTALVRRADEHRSSVMPGYTHGQRAQVVSLAHHLLAYVEMLQRDAERLSDARRRCDVLPLGSAALAGSTLPLDREAVARDLHFRSLSANSLDAVGDRDFVVEVVAACALLMTHISRVSEDIILWSTAEFGFIELDDAHATGSSLMPQKKNPDVLELARARTGRVIGDLVTLLTVVKGIPLAYDRDLQEDKRALFDAVDTASTTLSVLTEVIGRARFATQVMRNAASDPAMRATDVAEYLVGRGVAFREAHALVARAVRGVQQLGQTLADLSVQDWRRISAHFDKDVVELFDVDSALQRRVTAGGPSRRSVARQLARARRLIERTRRSMLGE
jgi:argininosuccinate lyase